MSTHTHTREGGTGENTSKLRITTQNMGGFGLEVRSHKNRTKAGPKMQYLRKSADRNSTDVYVLTETRIKTAAECQNIRIGQLRPTMTTVSGRTAAGVIVLTNKNCSYIEGSSRESNPAGHFIIGVYQIQGTRVIIGGVYLDSSGTDQVGVQAIQQINGHIEELQRAYNTRHTVLTGDFNVVLQADQCHSHRINKPQTSQHLQDMIVEYNLIDSGAQANNMEPTYRRHGDAGIYSRIDYAFSSLATTDYTLQWSSMDHAGVDVCINMPGVGGARLPRTRDWIIGSAEFLTLGRETIIKTILDHDQHFTYIEEQ
jgi:exonuclease III